MSHTLDDYREPHRLSAGLLALTVHVAFFALLMVGVRWQSKVPEEFSVELWGSLPTLQVPAEQPPVPAPEAAQPAPAQAPPPAKADIELREKKAKEAEAKEKQRKEEIAKAAAAANQEAERRELEAYAARRAQAVQENVRAEVAAATAAEQRRYVDMIRSKVKRNIIGNWSGLPESAESVFKVTLLPDGSVMDAVLLKSSGNPAYDDATERAIYKAQPLPMPKDAALQRMFRELRLTIRPKED